MTLFMIGVIGITFAVVIGAASGMLMIYISNEPARKDTTITEIRKLKQATDKYNYQINYYRHSPNRLWQVKMQLLTYLSSWSVNMAYHRVSRKMIIYAMSSTLNREYRLLTPDLPKLLASPEYQGRAKQAIWLFRKCRTIK